MYGSSSYGSTEYGGLLGSSRLTSVLLFEHGHLLNFIVKRPQKTFVNVVSVHSSIKKTTSKILSVVTSLRAAFTQNRVWQFSESLHLHSAISKKAIKIFSFIVSTNNKIVKQWSKSLTGSSSLSDSIAKKTKKIAGETITLLDRLSKTTSKKLLEGIILTQAFLLSKGNTYLIDFSEHLRMVENFVKKTTKTMLSSAVLGSKISFFYRRNLFDHLRASARAEKLTIKKAFSQSVALATALSKKTASVRGETVGVNATVIATKIYNLFRLESLTVRGLVGKKTYKIFVGLIKARDYFRIGGTVIELFFNESTRLHHNSVNTLLYFVKTRLAVFRPRGINDTPHSRKAGDPNQF